jgi:putative ABC transport system ATP-binding protein
MNMLKVLKEKGVTILMVTHSPEHGARADRIIEMLDGQVIGGNDSASLSMVADNTSVSSAHA